MNKPTLILQSPIFSRSGYGDHSRDILKSLRKMDKYDIKLVPMRWGNTPQNQVDANDEFGKWMLERVVNGSVTERPDIFIQISVANEFEPRGHYNIGITAGVETTICPKDFIDGCNKMNLIIVPSEFTKAVLATTTYHAKDNATGQIVNEFKIATPIVTLFEGVDVSIFSKGEPTDMLDSIPESFCFLVVGHWLKGDIGQDRKDIAMTIKTFATVFQHLPKDKRPALILKTSHAGFSVMDREATRDKIDAVLKTIGGDCPSVYLLHGDLSEADMASLYYHPKVKAMVSFTKGEGYGRPLAEFSLTGKPILVSGWSGQIDFLPADKTVLLEGQLTQVHESAADQFCMKEAQWFTVNYSNAANKLYDVYKNYATHSKNSSKLRENTLNNFTLEKMHDKFSDIMNTYVKSAPKVVPFSLPKLNPSKIQLPKLESK